MAGPRAALGRPSALRVPGYSGLDALQGVVPWADAGLRSNMQTSPPNLLGVLPHRPPFLFVDKVAEVGHERIVTRFHADPQADFFKGHYPGRPILPGVLLCECCFQSGALLIAHRKGGWSWTDGTPVLTRIQDARFKRPVLPGETVQCEVVLDDELERAFVMTGRASVGAELALRVGFTCMLAEIKPARG